MEQGYESLTSSLSYQACSKATLQKVSRPSSSSRKQADTATDRDDKDVTEIEEMRLSDMIVDQYLAPTQSL